VVEGGGWMASAAAEGGYGLPQTLWGDTPGGADGRNDWQTE
jgi:hypothetical protein